MANSLFTNDKSSRSLSEFEFLHDPSDKNSKLGVGSFASVKLAKEKKTGKQHAIKIISMHPNKVTNSDLHNIRTEISIHKKLDHPNIIKFYDYIHKDHHVYLVLDFAESGNLYSYIHKRKSLSPEEIFRFFYQSTLAIQYLHQNDVLHRDIKPENLLLDKHKNIKLCDFGWSTRRITEKRLTFCGTYEYMAPEIVHKKPYDYRVDIWSLGVLLYELIHREAPYKGRSLSEISKSLAKDHIRFSSSTHPEAKDLILKILKNNPNDRLSISQILSHPWVQSHLKTEEDDSLQVEEYRVSPRDLLKQQENRSVYGESPRVIPRRDHQHFKSEILASSDNDLHIESLGSQTRTNSNSHLFSSFSGSSTLKEKERERLREKSKEKERLREKSDSHVSHSGNQRSHIHELNANGALKAVDENVAPTRGHIKSSSTISTSILEKISFEDKVSTSSLPKRKIFESSMVSPNLKAKVDNIIHQLSSHSQTATHKSSEHVSMFSSRPLSRNNPQQPSQNPSSETSSIYRHHLEFSQPNQSQQPQSVYRAKTSSRLDENAKSISSFSNTFRVKPDVTDLKDIGSSQYTTKSSYNKKISFPKGDSQPSLYSSISTTTNRSARSKIGSKGSDMFDHERNFSLSNKFSHVDVTKSLNLKSFNNILSTADQNKYKIADGQDGGSSYNKYARGLDHKRKQSYKMGEDSGPANLHLSSLSERRNENKENKKDHMKDKESHMRIREDYTGKFAF